MTAIRSASGSCLDGQAVTKRPWPCAANATSALSEEDAHTGLCSDREKLSWPVRPSNAASPLAAYSRRSHPLMADVPIRDFDGIGLFQALDAERTKRGVSWRAVANEMWQMSAVLNAERLDHPISPSTIVNLGKRGGTSCQHALVMLRWLGRTPESFLTGTTHETQHTALPVAGPDRRLRWRLKKMYAALDARRREREMSWPQLAAELRCTPSQLTGLRTARYATGMTVAIRIVQWLERPAADFIYAAKW